MLENTIIYLIGFAGVGKYIIAKELSKLDEFRVIHSHLINDPIFNVITIDGIIPPSIWEQIRKVRAVVYETIEKYAAEDTSFIFTNQLFEENVSDLAIYNRVKEVAEVRNSTFIPIRLLVSEEEHKKRIISHERKNSFKVSDISYLDKIDGIEVMKIKDKNLIEVDTSNFSARESAEYILNKIKGLN